jgi:hypothetical protein
VSGGEWNTNRERKQLAADQREQDREMLRQEKRALRDLRFCAERSTLSVAEWRDLWRFMLSTVKRASASYGRASCLTGTRASRSTVASRALRISCQAV